MKGKISLRSAALIGGLPIMLLTAPFGEFYVFGRLVNYNDGVQTINNLLQHKTLFAAGIFAMLITFIYDIILAWALYIFLEPVNSKVALLGAWFRIVYAGLAIVALFNFSEAFQLINMQGIQQHYKEEQILQLVNARRLGMNLAYLVFGFYLVLGSILILRATYIPKVLGVLILLAGLSWIILSLQPFFFRQYDLSWIMLFAVGELVFGLWLLFKGTRIKEDAIFELSYK